MMDSPEIESQTSGDVATMYARLFSRMPNMDGLSLPVTLTPVPEINPGGDVLKIHHVFHDSLAPDPTGNPTAKPDDGKLSNSLFMCMLLERGQTDLGIIAAIRAFRSLVLYKTRDPVEIHWNAAYRCLQKNGGTDNPNLGDDDFARKRLGETFHQFVTKLHDNILNCIGQAETVEAPCDDGEVRPTPARTMSLPPPVIERDGMLAWDAVLFDLYAQLGYDHVERRREKARARFKTYKETGDATHAWEFWCQFKATDDASTCDIGGGQPSRSQFDELLLDIIWEEVVRKEWERQKYDFPHLTHGSLSTIIPALRPGNNVVVESMQNDNVKKLVLYTSEGRAIAETSAIRAAAESAITMIRTGAEILSSTLGIMLTVREVAGFWNRYYNSGKDWQSWGFDSYEDLCQTFKINPSKHRHEVRQILNAQSNMDFTWPCGGTGSMISLFEGQGPRRTIRPTITANYPITPRYSYDIEHSIGDTRISRDARWKIPIPDPSEFPDVVGSRNKTAEQQVVFLVMMSRVAENARAGELLLSEEDWAHCVAEAGVSAALASKTLDGWVAQGHLAKLPAGGWWLGERQARLADIIREGYVIADRGRKGIPPPRKRRKGAARS